MRQQDQAGRILVVIELRQKRLHDLGRFGPGTGLGVKVAVAPGLVGADEEDLHAGLAFVQVQRYHIRLGHALRVDALGGLHLRQRLDPVAQGGGAFKLHPG